MARNTGPVCKICKSQGEKLFLKGERCYTPKCAVDKSRDRSSRGIGFGGANTRRRSRISDHGLQLQQKQKGRHIYGLFERQFRKTFDRAAREPGVTGLNLMKLLERRLDNVVYRAGFATSRPAGATDREPRAHRGQRSQGRYTVIHRQDWRCSSLA